MPTPDFRSSPSGPLIENANEVTSFNGRAGAVVAVAGDYSASEITNDSTVDGDFLDDALDTLSAFDVVVTDSSDLPAAVAGVIILTSGSYAFIAAFSLGTDRLVVPTGVEVLLMGMGPSKIISTAIASQGVIELQSGCVAHLVNLSVNNTDTGGYGILTDSDDTTMINCSILTGTTGGSEGVRQTGGISMAVGCLVTDSDTGWAMRGGDAHLSQHRSLDNTNDAMDVTAASSSVTWIGGWIKNITDGIAINADITVMLFNAVECNNGTEFIDYASGAVERVSIINCHATTFNAIQWAALSIPSLGLTLGHNTWDTAGTAYEDFDEADTGVNSKGDIDSGGLKTETAIVP